MNVIYCRNSVDPTHQDRYSRPPERDDKMSPPHQPHVLAIPYPAQGHVIPLLEVVQRLAEHGIRITFVNTDFNHSRVLSAIADDNMDILAGDRIRLVSIPDGMAPGEDRNDLRKLTEAMYRSMPGKLEELIQEINSGSSKGSEDKITCVLADVSMSWPVDVAVRMKIPRVVFWPVSVALFAQAMAVPKMIDEGIITDDDGTPIGQSAILLAPGMPAMTATNLVWMTTPGDGPATQRNIFNGLSRHVRAAKLGDRVICNSSPCLEPGALEYVPQMKPIGPLLASDRVRGSSAGCFWAEDSSCLSWLDEQPPRSVVYVAFGSFTIFDRTQFQELALGLELMGRPFVWVVRPDLAEQSNDLYPEGFQERVSGRGKMVGWAPQQKVLSHPSVACFLSHCGWNSVMEATRNGVPLLCWPYFADQFLDQDYVCDVWKTGLKLDRGEEGIIRKAEIKLKVDLLLGNEEFTERARDMKEKVESGIGEGGESHKNLVDLVEWIKAL